MEAVNKTSKNGKIIKLTLLAIVSTILITVSAKVKIPFYPVDNANFCYFVNWNKFWI